MGMEDSICWYYILFVPQKLRWFHLHHLHIPVSKSNLGVLFQSIYLEFQNSIKIAE